MSNHLLIVEDHEDVFENLKNKISQGFSNMEITISDTCDKAYSTIKRNTITNPITVLILDLTFTSYNQNSVLKFGKDLLSILKKDGITIPTIIYSSHNTMEHIYPIINNYEPLGYVVKSNTSTNELIFGLGQVLKGKTYYSQIVTELQMKRTKYEIVIDEIDEQIIKFLPKANSINSWDGKILNADVPMSYKSIKKRIDKLCDKFEVDNEKLLLLKLQKLAIL